MNQGITRQERQALIGRPTVTVAERSRLYATMVNGKIVRLGRQSECDRFAQQLLDNPVLARLLDRTFKGQ